MFLLYRRGLTVYDSLNIKDFECTTYVFCHELEWRLTCAIFTGRSWDSRVSSTCVHATWCAYISIGSPAGHHYTAHTSCWAAVTKTCVTVFMSSAFIWLMKGIHLIYSSYCPPSAYVENIYADPWEFCVIPTVITTENLQQMSFLVLNVLFRADLLNLLCSSCCFSKIWCACRQLEILIQNEDWITIHIIPVILAVYFKYILWNKNVLIIMEEYIYIRNAVHSPSYGISLWAHFHKAGF